MTFCFIFSTSSAEGELAARVRSTRPIVSVCTAQSVPRSVATSCQKEVTHVPSI